MCDFCSCRQMEVVAALTADHIQLATLSLAVRRALATRDDARAHDLFAELEALLADHVAREEAGLLAQLAADGEDVERILGEHRALTAAPVLVSGPGWAMSITSVLDQLAAHIAAEEYDVFPASMIVLSPERWAAAATATAATASATATAPAPMARTAADLPAALTT